MKQNGLQRIQGMFKTPSKMIQEDTPVIEEVKPKRAKRKRKAVTK